MNFHALTLPMPSRCIVRRLGGLVITAFLLLALQPARAGALAFLMEMLTYGPIKVAGLKVVTSQVATAQKAQITNEVLLANGAMAGRAQLETTIQHIELFRNYGLISGQGPQTCSAINQRNDIEDIENRRNSYAFTAMPTGGRSSVPREGYEDRRTEQRLDAYCSADEHNLKLCRSRFDGMASASTDYNKLLRADQLTAKQLKAAQEFVANLVPPQLPLQRSAECGAACQTDRASALRSDALASMVAVPMAAQLSSRIGVKTFPQAR